MRALLGLMCGTMLLSGCGASAPKCTVIQVLEVDPSKATVDHAAKVPGNEQQFTSEFAFEGSPAGCPAPALAALAYPTWTNPDPLDITISSAADATNGLATCNSATSGAVTLTAVTGTGTNQQMAAVQLTCQ